MDLFSLLVGVGARATANETVGDEVHELPEIMKPPAPQSDAWL